jgi:hypothetical protein
MTVNRACSYEIGLCNRISSVAGSIQQWTSEAGQREIDALLESMSIAATAGVTNYRFTMREI